MISDTIVLADGKFPEHEIPLGYLKSAARIICCDGSAEKLVLFGLQPFAIVGDMDTISEEMANRFAGRMYPDLSQDTNDLTKAVSWCIRMGYNNLVIVGGTGKREDHTIGNISLLTDYAEKINVRMITDTGIFMPFLNSCKIQSNSGQQVSLFSIDPETEVTSHGLRYPLNRKKINNWWVATLNEALGESFSLEFTSGRLIVYLKYMDSASP